MSEDKPKRMATISAHGSLDAAHPLMTLASTSLALDILYLGDHFVADCFDRHYLMVVRHIEYEMVYTEPSHLLAHLNYILYCHSTLG